MVRSDRFGADSVGFCEPLAKWVLRLLGLFAMGPAIVLAWMVGQSDFRVSSREIDRAFGSIPY